MSVVLLVTIFLTYPPLLSTASPQLQDVALSGTMQPGSLGRSGHWGERFLSTSSDCQDPPHSKRPAQRNNPGVLCHKDEGIGMALQLSDSVLGNVKLTPVSICALRASTLPPALSLFKRVGMALLCSSALKSAEETHNQKRRKSFQGCLLGCSIDKCFFLLEGPPTDRREQ